MLKLKKKLRPLQDSILARVRGCDMLKEVIYLGEEGQSCAKDCSKCIDIASCTVLTGDFVPACSWCKDTDLRAVETQAGLAFYCPTCEELLWAGDDGE